MTKEEILDYFKDINGAYNNCNMYDDLSRMLDELLEEQDRLLHKKQKDIDKLCADISDLRHRFHEKTEIVRCKDCKHRPKVVSYKNAVGVTQTSYEFPEDSKCPCENTNDNYYSWCPDDDWFCADGERKEG